MGLAIIIAIIGAAIIIRGKKYGYKLDKDTPSAVPTASYHVNGSGGDVVAFDNPIVDYDTDSAMVIISPFADDQTS